MKSLAQAVEAVDNARQFRGGFVNKAVSETTEGPATDGAKGVHRVDEEGLDSRTGARRFLLPTVKREAFGPATASLHEISETALVSLNGKTTERM